MNTDNRMFSILESLNGNEYLIREILGDGTDIGTINKFVFDCADENEQESICIKAAEALGFIKYRAVGKKLYSEFKNEFGL